MGTGGKKPGCPCHSLAALPEGVNADLLAKVLANPEMAALLTSLAKAMEKKGES